MLLVMKLVCRHESEMWTPASTGVVATLLASCGNTDDGGEDIMQVDEEGHKPDASVPFHCP